MELKARTVRSLSLARKPKQIQQWIMGRQLQIATLASVTLGTSTALYGSAGRWVFLEFALPQGWAVGVIVFSALKPDRARGGRQVIVARRLMWSTLPALFLQQVAYVLDHQRGDGLVISGWLALLIGLELAAIAPIRLHKALRRLANRTLLGVPAKSVDSLKHELERTGNRWSLIGGTCVAVVLLATWPRAAEFASNWHSWTIGPAVADQILVVVAGAVAGGWLGRMTGYGRLGNILVRREIQLRVVPGHPDRAGGLKPVGDFYLYQSLAASVPAVFLAVWVLLLSLGSSNPSLGHYRPYLDQYILLLMLAIVFEILVFVFPLYSIHVIMKNQKEDVLLAEADRLSPVIEAAQAQLEDEKNEDRDATMRQLAQLAERYENLEKTPTWPIDPSIRRRFTLRNLGLLVPFVGYFVGPTPFWQHVSDLLKGFG